jgi:sugar transferase (PEP-CTERM system associated)
MALSKISKKKLLLLLGDVILATGAYVLAHFLRLERHLVLTDLGRRLFTLVLLLVVEIISFYIFDFYNVRKGFPLVSTLKMMLGASLLTSLLIVVFFFISPYELGRGIFLISLFITAALVTGWRMVSSRLFRLAVPPRNVLIVGTDRSAERIASLLAGNPECRVAGFIGEAAGIKEGEILGDFQSLKAVVRSRGIQDIIIAAGPLVDADLVRSLIDCRLWGVRISDIPRAYEQWLQKIPLMDISEEWLLWNEGFSNIGSRFYDRTKRLMDLVLSSTLLLLALPVGALISLLIKVSSKGPVFYAQERVGRNYKEFRLVKFRTMAVGAEDRHPRWAEEKDRRVTGIGRVLRKTRLDELPQLLNIIRGKMSLIGPRPERRYFVNRLVKEIPFYSLRFSVKPGLTGWAQVNFRYAASVEETLEKLSYDLYYIKNMSLFLDLRIFIKTVRIILFGLGR